MKRLRLLTFVFALLALLAAATLAHAQESYQDVLDSGLTNDEAHSYSLIAQSKGSPDKLAMLEEARKFSPDVPAPYFKLAWSSLPNVITSIRYFGGGIKAYARSFWWTFSLIGLLFASVFVSLIITATITVLIRLPIQLPLLAHDINENKLKFMIPLVLLVAAPGGPLFFLAGALVVMSIHLKKLDRAPVYVVLLALAISPLIVKAANVMLSASSSPELRAIVAVNEQRDNDYALGVLSNSESREARFSYALALKRTGRYDEAEAIYNELQEEKPDWAVMNNLANIYSARNQTDMAKETLKKAAEIKNSAVLLYNLSQIYRGTLDYAEGDKYYTEASALDRDDVSRYTTLVSVSPNRFVIDVNYSAGDFWKMAISGPRDYIAPFPLGTLPSVGLALLLVVVTVLFGLTITSAGFRCSRCSKIVCNICSRDSRWGQMCPTCYGSLVRVKDMDRQKRVSALLSAYQHKDKIKGIVRILSFLPPGIAQISVGRTLSGFAFMWAFIFCVTFIWLNPLISTGLDGFSHSWLNVPMVLAMLAIYAGSTLYVNGRLEGGWL